MRGLTTARPGRLDFLACLVAVVGAVAKLETHENEEFTARGAAAAAPEWCEVEVHLVDWAPLHAWPEGAVDLWPAIEAGKLHLPIDKTFPLAQAAEALAHMKANAHFGKIVLVM